MNKSSYDKNDEESLNKSELILENLIYWLYIQENFILVKITKIQEQKEIYYKELEISYGENRIRLIENSNIVEKRIAFNQNYLFKSFSISQLEPNSDNLLDTSDVSYSTILYNLKLKLKNCNNIIKAGKIFLGINMITSEKICYKNLITKFFNLKFEENKNFTYIINGLPNTGKTSMMKNFIEEIIFANIYNFSLNDNSHIKNDIKKIQNLSKENNKNFQNKEDIINLGTDKIANYSHFKNNFPLKKHLVDLISVYSQLINFFGNTIESENRMDCSRYMRIVKFYYKNNDKDKSKNYATSNEIKKLKFKYFLLEKNRILNAEKNKLYFNIIHVIFHGLYEILNPNKSIEKYSFWNKVNSAYPEYVKYIIDNFGNFSKYIVEKIHNEFKDLYTNISFIKYFKYDWNKNNTAIQNYIKIDNSDYSDDDINNDYNSFSNNDHKVDENLLIKYFVEKFAELLGIFSKISLHKKIIVKIFNIVLLIFHLKDINYPIDNEEKVFLELDDPIIKNIFVLLSIEIEEEKSLFIKKLTSREIFSPTGSMILIKFSNEEALRHRDNLVKFLYDNLFKFIEKFSNYMINFEIEKINCDILGKQMQNFNFNLINFKSEKKDFNYLQIIECFGFENSSNPLENNLESFFVNYSNDKINNIFFDLLVKKELETYENEGLNQMKDTMNAKSTQYDDLLFKQLAKKFQRNSIVEQKANQIISNANVQNKRNSVTQRPNFSKVSGIIDQDIERTVYICEEEAKGIFSTINSQSILIKNNKGLISSLCNNIKTNWPELTVTNKSFLLYHIGCFVEYGGEDFILRNTESLKDDVKILFKELFKNMIGLTIKNFNLDKENLLKYFNKNFNFSDENEIKNQLKRQTRGSVVGRPIAFGGRSKFLCENFIIKFKKLMSNIMNSDLSIIKLLKSGPEKQIEGYQNFSFNESKSKLKINQFNVDGNMINDIEGDFINLNDFYKRRFYYEFDNKFFLKQIYSSGLLESVQLTKSGYFFRCDFFMLRKKLIPFKSFFDCFSDKKNDEVDNWKPDSKFLLQIGNILNVKETDLILGKNTVFLKNHAIIEKQNHHFFKLKDFPSLIIFNLTKITMRKIKNIVWTIKYFKSIVLKKNVDNFLKRISFIHTKWRFNQIINTIIFRYCKFLFRVKYIQRILRKFLKKKYFLIMLQKNIKKFLIKLKISKRKIAIEKLVKNINKLIQIQNKFCKKDFFELFKFMIGMRNTKANVIIKIYSNYKVKKDTKLLVSKILNFINIYNKKFFFNKLKLKNLEVNSSIKIQTLSRLYLSKKSFTDLKQSYDKRKTLIGILIINILVPIVNKNFFGNFLFKLRNFGSSKLLKAKLLQKNFRIFLSKKEQKRKEYILDSFNKLDYFFRKKENENKGFTIDKINEKIKLNIEINKNESSNKISNIFRRKSTLNKINKIKEEKKENEIKIKNNLQIFEKLIEKAKNIIFKKNFLANFEKYNENLIKKNRSITKIQCLARILTAKRNFKKSKINNDKFKIFSHKFQILQNILKKKSIIQLKTHDNFLKEKNKKVILIQNFIRSYKAKKKFIIYKEEEISKKVLIENQNKFIDVYQKIKTKNLKYFAFDKISIYYKNLRLRNASALKIVSFFNSIKAKKELKQLKKIKEDEKKIMEKKLYMFSTNINRIVQNVNFRDFIEKFKNYLKAKEKSANLIKENIRKLMIKKKFSVKIFVEKLQSLLDNNKKKIFVEDLKRKLFQIKELFNKSVVKTQSLFRKIKAIKKLNELKKEQQNLRLKSSTYSLEKIMNNYSIKNKHYSNNLKREFFERFFNKYLKIKEILKIQKNFREFKHKKKLIPINIVKALEKLNDIINLNLLGKKILLIYQLKEFSLKKKINNRKNNISAKIIQKAYFFYKKLKLEAKLEKIKQMKFNKLSSLIKYLDDIKNKNILKEKIYLFQHNLQINYLLEIFCHKIQKIRTINQYFKKTLFSFMKKSYLENRATIKLRKFFIRTNNISNRKIKEEFISNLRVSSKYIYNKPKINKENESRKVSQEKINSVNNSIFRDNNTESNSHQNLEKNFTPVKSKEEAKNTVIQKNPRISTINKTNISAVINKTPNLIFKNSDKTRSDITPKFYLINEKKNRNESEEEINMEVVKNISKKDSQKNIDSSSSEFEFGEFKRFKLDKNILKGGLEYNDDDERSYTYQAANQLISKYSRNSHKISLNSDQKNNIPNNDNPISSSQTINKRNDINKSNIILKNNNEKLTVTERTSVINKKPPNFNINDNKNLERLKNKIYIKNKNNFNWNENQLLEQRLTSRPTIVKNDVPSYKNLIELSNINLNQSNISHRKTVAGRPKNLMNHIDLNTKQEEDKNKNIKETSKNKSTKNIKHIGKNDEGNLTIFSRKQSEPGNISSRIEAVFRNLDKLNMLTGEKIENLELQNDNENLNEFQRICMSDYPKSEKHDEI